MSELHAFRQSKDEFFAVDRHSPLTADQRVRFAGLDYFDEDESLRFEVDLVANSDGQNVQLQTSTGDVQTYTRIGRFSIQVDGEEAWLTIFEGPHGLFLPFVDGLAGEKTYPAGRYLEPERLPSGRYLVDFNLAYNPYCAYNERWSCPLTPVENRIHVPIRAGEKIFVDPG